MELDAEDWQLLVSHSHHFIVLYTAGGYLEFFAERGRVDSQGVVSGNHLLRFTTLKQRVGGIEVR